MFDGDDDDGSPLIVLMLKECAQRNAGADSTGVASDGAVSVHFYPRSGNFAWFDRTGPISKRWATELLTAGKWSPPPSTKRAIDR